MWPAWFYLSRTAPLARARMSLNELNARAKIAREAPFDRIVENITVVFFNGAARGHEQTL